MENSVLCSPRERTGEMHSFFLEFLGFTEKMALSMAAVSSLSSSWMDEQTKA